MICRSRGCSTRIVKGDFYWLVTVPQTHIDLRGRVTRYQVEVPYCDRCGSLA